MNQPETFVIEMCNGIMMSHPELEFLLKHKVIKKKEINPNKVTLISGGGSGHEPAHAGYVGKGMLDAAVCGDIFASPSQVQVYHGLKSIKSNEGTLMIIKNYSGDMMNFQNAAYMAMEDGMNVDYVKVDDDIAVQDSLYTVGRRGVAGTVLVHKIAGAAAERGYSLAKVKELAELANANIRSIGFAFSSCTVPAKGTPTFDIEVGDMEYGVGIHGEPGIKREKIVSADELAERMVESLVKELDINEDEVTVLINGFGSTPLQELYLLNDSVLRILNKKKIKLYRTFVGNFMTSIDMSGASVSFMKMNPLLKELLDDESDAPAFRVSGKVDSVQYKDMRLISEENKTMDLDVDIQEDFGLIEDDKLSLNNLIYLVHKMGECIIKNEVYFCDLDSYAGDGDFGMSIAKGFKQLKREYAYILENHASNIGEFLDACSMVIMEYCGGASGPIWGSAFRAAAKQAGNKSEVTVKEFGEILQSAVEGIQKTGERSFGRGAIVGDKTLIDALVPCADAWKTAAINKVTMKDAFILGANAAKEGAEKTKDIVARMGRAGTVGERSLGHPDAGAFALGIIFTELSQSLQ